MKSGFPLLNAFEAAELIQNNDTICFSGFTPAGAAKTIPRAIANKAKLEHAEGREFKIGIITGASTGESIDGCLAEAEAVLWRTPYQSNARLRQSINEGKTKFFDMHLSQLQQWIRSKFLGPVSFAIVEAVNVDPLGRITLSTSVGATNTFLDQAEKILIEINRYHSNNLLGFHDIYEPLDPPNRREIPLYSTRQRCGDTTVQADPSKIVGIIHTNEPDEVGEFKPADLITTKIGENVANFLAGEIKKNRIPKEFLPIQSGVGNIANAVLAAVGTHPDIPRFEMYSEVIQDSVIDAMERDQISFASATSLTVSPDTLDRIYKNLNYFRSRMVLRPQEISNSPEIIRRLGIISINTAIEVDIFGNVNSTHIMGNNMMNGIGGSGDFTRNAYISIFTCPSTAKGGKISSIVPLCSHLDHSEHSVQAIITEQGIADLRGKDPHERALEIINKCAHPEYRETLLNYSKNVIGGHTPQTLNRAFAMHQQYLNTGSMQNVDWK